MSIKNKLLKLIVIICILILPDYKYKSETQLSNHQKMIYFIRHAESQYNIVESQLKQKYGEQYMKEMDFQNAKFSKDYLDVDITEKGIEQALKCREQMKDVDIDLIIVSPLRRALKTCHLVFDGHKNNPPVIVDPAFRQVLCSSNDIGSKLQESQKQFTKFDFSLITDPDFWYLHNLHDQEIKERIMKRIEQAQHENKIQAGITIVIEFLQEYFKIRQADPDNIHLLRKVLPSLQKQRDILLQKLKIYKNIAVVSHSENIKAYVGYKINNCEVYPFSEQKLRELKVE